MDKTEKYLKSIDVHMSKIERHLKKLVEQNDAALEEVLMIGVKKEEELKE